MRIIKYNKGFLDVFCEKYPNVMVGSITCQKCDNNKSTSDDEILCDYSIEDEVLYWSCNQHQERLNCTSKEDAIQYYLDDIEEGKEPDSVRVYGFAHQKINDDGIGILEDFISYLDENYGDPDGYCTDLTDNMKKAAKVFVDAIIKEYDVWTCDCIYEEEIDLKKWIEEHKG